MAAGSCGAVRRIDVHGAALPHLHGVEAPRGKYF